MTDGFGKFFYQCAIISNLMYNKQTWSLSNILLYSMCLLLTSLGFSWDFWLISVSLILVSKGQLSRSELEHLYVSLLLGWPAGQLSIFFLLWGQKNRRQKSSHTNLFQCSLRLICWHPIGQTMSGGIGDYVQQQIYKAKVKHREIRGDLSSMLKSTTYLMGDFHLESNQCMIKRFIGTHVLCTLKSIKFSKQVIVGGGITVMVDIILW